MNLQQVIDDLKAKAAEYKANNDAEVKAGRTPATGAFAIPRPAFVWAWSEGALLERATYYEQQLAAEQAGYAAQERELRTALHRDGEAGEANGG